MLSAEERILKRLQIDDSHFEVYQDRAKEYRWRLKDAHGENIASGGEGFKSHRECLDNVALVRALAHRSPVE